MTTDYQINDYVESATGAIGYVVEIVGGSLRVRWPDGRIAEVDGRNVRLSTLHAWLDQPQPLRGANIEHARDARAALAEESRRLKASWHT